MPAWNWLEKGIKKSGTKPHITNTALIASPASPVLAKKSKIGGSVGPWDKEARNAKADVTTIQEMLRNAGMILHDPRIDPGRIDGKIDRDASESTTVQAIKTFQGRFFTRPDGVIDPDKRTWRELVSVLAGGGKPVTPAAAPRISGKARFVFPSMRSRPLIGPARRAASPPIATEGEGLTRGAIFIFPAARSFMPLAREQLYAVPIPSMRRPMPLRSIMEPLLHAMARYRQRRS